MRQKDGNHPSNYAHRMARHVEQKDLRVARSNVHDVTLADVDELYLKMLSSVGERTVKCAACGTEYKESWLFEGECWPSCDRTAEMANNLQGISGKYNLSKIKKAMEDEGIK